MYKRQPYPANYVSEDFLRGLSENRGNSYTLRDVCPKTMMLTQHCSTMLLMAWVFVLIKDGDMAITSVDCLTMLEVVFICALMYATWNATADRFRHVRFSFIIHATIKLLQPVLQTLTSSFSCDTVYALAIMISFVNILTQDYDLTRPDEGYVRDADALPMNCLILVAILVSSRFGCPKKVGLVSALADVRQASAYLQLYMMTFSLLPSLQRLLMVRWAKGALRSVQEHKSMSAIYISTLAVVIFTCGCLYTWKPVLVPAYLVGNVVVNVVAPLGYIYAQKYKRNVSGPWNPDQVPRNRKSS